MGIVWEQSGSHPDSEVFHWDAGGVERGEKCCLCDGALSYPYISARPDSEILRFHPLCAMQWVKNLMQDLQHVSAGFEEHQCDHAVWARSAEALREVRRDQAKRFWQRVFGVPKFSFGFLLDWIRHEERLDRTPGVQSHLEAIGQMIVADLRNSGVIEATGEGMWRVLGHRFEPSASEVTRLSSAEPRVDRQRNFSGLQKREIYLRANGHCQGCGSALDSDWHADHVFPHSRGGRTEVINGQALCQPCNSRKSAKVLTVDE